MPSYITKAEAQKLVSEAKEALNARITELVKRCDLIEAGAQGDEATSAKVAEELAVVREEVARLEAVAGPTDLETLIPAGFTRVRYDDCADPEYQDLWGEWTEWDAKEPSRIGTGTFEGGPARTCEARSTDVLPEQEGHIRCEMGKDDWRFGEATSSDPQGTFHVYEEGDHTVTVGRRRLPADLDVSGTPFRAVLQIKQANPATTEDVGPALEIEAIEGNWTLINYWTHLWSIPCHPGVDTTFVVETVHSPDPSKGWVRIAVLEDGGLVGRSDQIACRNMSVFSADNPYAARKKGDVDPCHHRAGVYQEQKLGACTVVVGPTEIWK